ncbi:MAG: bifunctional oligoribonuclease/PAP phosphatase NrnA [Clostridia bacterium]|nr:bifunctional oligoribonuclease/PAP phosphatase NrnA [Clostridia bacterium]
MRIEFDEAVSELKNADDILILCHRNPDGDTLGSGFALLRALRAAGKRVKLFCDDKIPEKFSYLYEGAENEEFEEKFVVSVDVAERKLLGEGGNEKYGDRVDLSFDHHGTSRLFAKKTYCEPESASACEIIFSVIRALGVEISGEIASCLYTGMSTDTGCFRYSNVTPRTHRIAAELIEKGADHARINVKMFETKSMNNIMLERMCLDSLESYGEGKVAVITVTKAMLDECKTEKSAIDAIKPITRQIEGVEIGLTVKEENDGKTGISVRTSESYDASLICAHFGGGGHERAAGCEMKCSPAEAKERAVSYILNEVL